MNNYIKFSLGRECSVWELYSQFPRPKLKNRLYRENERNVCGIAILSFTWFSSDESGSTFLYEQKKSLLASKLIR